MTRGELTRATGRRPRGEASVTPRYASNTGSRRRGEQRNRQIFVDGSGRRRRLLRYAVLLVACACAGCLLLLATALTGVLRRHAGQAPGAV
ncbi:hypothetical protein [Streptomyces sp. MZ04]|uniref:hypothetical protein n=1 Tax=Streptomyces sp. MZ04 TaxID=2559236 RepID=UPI00107EDA3E|nr:hypothetical protein [Streptomyces sp. MZ04]TGB08217.1 hypothetical protein E2651_19915 [Streptomyces sp. MZ04]